ncbi:MAG: phytanoyl-CoA dioxygenase family protein [Opitutaceae bacterium]
MDELNSVALRQQFNRDGYHVMPRYFSAAQVDALCAEVAQSIEEAPMEVVVDNLRSNQRTFWGNAEERETRYFKFNDLFLLSERTRATVLEAGLARLLANLIGEPVVLCSSLNFHKGSSQHLHIDSLFMTPLTPHALIATWIALEDAHPDSGPLIYYPGSHLIPLYRFQDGTNRSTPAEMPAWNDYIAGQVQSRGLKPQTFLAAKGDVFIWHADLLHGGSPIKDMSRTRQSLVSHYFSESDCRRAECMLVPLHGNFWMKRLPQPVHMAPEKFSAIAPFPESTYLERHPDVKAAVRIGEFASGFEHYRQFGHKEGRGI